MAEPQLALEFPHDPALSPDEFLPHPGTQSALDYLGRTDTWPSRRLVLWGGPGVGKTHLLHLWARELGAALVSGPTLTEPFWPESAVAIDDADRAASEEALLHLINAAAEARRPVLLTVSRPAGRIVWRLPDLASRLRAATAIEIGAPDEEFLALLFAKLLSERQLPVAPALQSWMLLRLPRTPAVIREVAARLDYAAMAAKSGVTRALATDALSDLFSPEPVQETSR